MKIAIVFEDFCCSGTFNERIDAIFLDDTAKTAEEKARNFISEINSHKNRYFSYSFVLYETEGNGTFEILN